MWGDRLSKLCVSLNPANEQQPKVSFIIDEKSVTIKIPQRVLGRGLDAAHLKLEEYVYICNPGNLTLYHESADANWRVERKLLIVCN